MTSVMLATYPELIREVLHHVLHGGWVAGIDGAWIVEDRICQEPGLASRGHQPTAPITEAISIGGHCQRRVSHQMVRALQIRNARVVHVERQNHRRRLRAIVDDIESDADFHCTLILSYPQAPQPPAR